MKAPINTISSASRIFQCPVGPSVFGLDNWGNVDVENFVLRGPDIGHGIPFEQSDIFEAFEMVYVAGKEWNSTKWFNANAETIEKGKPLWECRSREALLQRLTIHVDGIFKSMSRWGYLSQEKIAESIKSGAEELEIYNSNEYHTKISPKHEIKVGINEEGKLLFLDGRHRLCIAKILKQSHIPIRVVFIHERWLTNYVRHASYVSSSNTTQTSVRDAILTAIQISNEKDKPVDFLNYESYIKAARTIGGGHWENAYARWCYHEAAIACARKLSLKSSDSVLEMGTMGISIVPGGHTIDYSEKWNVAGFKPTYNHDARVIPWPIPDKKYDLFVALRVFHHLHPNPGACFQEAKRIARNIIIVCPEAYDVEELRSTSAGIPEKHWLEWNGNKPASEKVSFPDWIGNLYFWKESELL